MVFANNERVAVTPRMGNVLTQLADVYERS